MKSFFLERNHMYDNYSLYLYNPYSRIIDYGVRIEVWYNPNFDIKLSAEDIEK